MSQSFPSPANYKPGRKGSHSAYCELGSFKTLQKLNPGNRASSVLFYGWGRQGTKKLSPLIQMTKLRGDSEPRECPTVWEGSPSVVPGPAASALPGDSLNFLAAV